MKKNDLINPALSEVIASLGHADMLVSANAGMPILTAVQRVVIG
jgi:D-ribose pyranose/furanose isomerase RbsD